jgi:hypothetical protein
MQTIPGKVERLRRFGFIEACKNIFNRVQQVVAYPAPVTAFVEPLQAPMFETPGSSR